MDDQSLLIGEVVEEHVALTLTELCRSCAVSEAQVFELVDQGVVEPLGREPDGWRFVGGSLRRVRLALHLQRDLGVNAAGAALALDLIDELEAVRARNGSRDGGSYE